jgi:hypothetical protein
MRRSRCDLILDTIDEALAECGQAVADAEKARTPCADGGWDALVRWGAVPKPLLRPAA